MLKVLKSYKEYLESSNSFLLDFTYSNNRTTSGVRWKAEILYFSFFLPKFLRKLIFIHMLTYYIPSSLPMWSPVLKGHLFLVLS